MSNLAVAQELVSLLGDRYTESSGVCMEHGTDISHFDPCPPDAVVFPESVDEVQAIVRACAKHNTAIIPYGVGSSLEGNISALHGGVCVDMSRMNNIVAVHQEDHDVVVQPGVTRNQLNDYLRDTGLFFPIDPGADASIGGMASTRASGTNAVRYGTMKDNVLSLEVVTPSGDAVRTAQRARKSSAGYDMTRLYVGSEGTLGIITEITLKLHPVPEHIVSATCEFNGITAAIQSVIETIQMGVPMARIEFLDAETIKAVNHSSKLGLAEKPMLLLEFHGTEQSVAEQVQTTQEILGEHGGENFLRSKTPEERTKLWQARHYAAHAISAYATGTKIWWTDVCVPISRLAECIERTHIDIQATGIFAPILGHVGDGNFHLAICEKEGADTARAEGLNQRLVERALSMQGTCTGEHGIGHGKIDFLRDELGPTVDIMRQVKQALDPQNIMNPGKIVQMPRNS